MLAELQEHFDKGDSPSKETREREKKGESSPGFELNRHYLQGSASIFMKLYTVAVSDVTSKHFSHLR